MNIKYKDNLSSWRAYAKDLGLIKSSYPSFHKDEILAEIIGVILGDGHIEVFPRTERLLIFSNSNNRGFINRYSQMVELLFSKKPYVYKMNQSNCVRISLYEKHISRRLGIPPGSRKDVKIKTPKWILRNNKFMIAYIRGLYEAEGSFSVHKPTSTYKLFFSNKNKSLQLIVRDFLIDQGFHPNISSMKVQISRKEEVYRLIEVLRFRKY